MFFFLNILLGDSDTWQQHTTAHNNNNNMRRRWVAQWRPHRYKCESVGPFIFYYDTSMMAPPLLKMRDGGAICFLLLHNDDGPTLTTIWNTRQWGCLFFLLDWGHRGIGPNDVSRRLGQCMYYYLRKVGPTHDASFVVSFRPIICNLLYIIM
jgi:hypothetical protein